MIVSTEGHETSGQIQQSLMIKTVNKLGMEGNVSDFLKDIDKLPTGGIVLSGRRLKTFPYAWEQSKVSVLRVLV